MITTRITDNWGNPVSHLTQWDTGVELNIEIYGVKITDPLEIHFANEDSDHSYVVKSSKVNEAAVRTIVPNALLVNPKRIYAYIYIGDSINGRTIQVLDIPVRSKPLPDGYEYVNNPEVIELNTVVKRAELLAQQVTEDRERTESAADRADLAKQATEALAKEVNNVNVESTQTPTGVIIRTTDRTGVTTETVLDGLVQINTWKDIRTVVQNGLAKKLIHIGDIFTAKRTDPITGKTNEIPWQVADVRNIATPEGEAKEAVIMQMHRVLPEEVMFDAWEAFYIAKDGLAPGTYHVVIAEKWGDHHNVGDAWSFTLTKPVPKGGLLGGFHDTPYSGFDSAKVESFNSLTDTAPIESVVPRKGIEGTKLGDFTFAGNAQLNSIQRCCYGYNNYKQSYQRQYLNNSGKGWWKAQNEYDLPPSNYKDIFGFMTGWDEEFLSVLKPFKSVIARNNVTDGGGVDEVNDIFVLPSLEEMNIKKQVSGEGPVLPYWKEVSTDGAEFPWYIATPELVHLDINGSARFVRFRSANVYGAYYAWYAGPSGYVGGSGARGACSGAPLAAIY